LWAPFRFFGYPRGVVSSRTLVLGLMLALSSACSDAKQDGPPPKPPAVDDGEQARFDAERRPDKLVEALGIQPGSRVADIGAGSGLLTIHLARAVAPNGQVVATDVDGAVLELNAQRLRAAKLESVVERRVVAPDTPGLEPGAYDAILLAEVDHYFSEPVTWLRAAATALKPEGRIVISNRIYHRAQSMASAKKAGLALQSESTPMPNHFVAVFTSEGK
jgi:cyclopropane fatty-acyl-phospholipid synthase-like methyltransferase